MISNFYQKENYYKNKLTIFINIEKNEKLIIYDNELKINDGGNCDFCSIIVNFFEPTNNISVEQYLEKIFTDYLKFIDNIIETMYRKQCFLDQYLILLTRIEEHINKMIPGLLNLKITYENDINMYNLIKSIIFSLFDFFKILKLLKENIHNQNMKNDSDIDMDIDMDIDNDNDYNVNKLSKDDYNVRYRNKKINKRTYSL